MQTINNLNGYLPTLFRGTSKRKWSAPERPLSPFPVACLRSTTAILGKDHTWETGKNEGGRCVIKRMENQEAQGLGEKLDLGSPLNTSDWGGAPVWHPPDVRLGNWSPCCPMQQSPVKHSCSNLDLH